MLKIVRVALLATTMYFPATQMARAWFVPAFLGGLATGLGATSLGGALFGLGGSAFGAFAAGASLGAFLTSGLGSLLLSVGLSALQYALAKKTPKMDSARINARVSEGERWVVGGPVRSGGTALFGEFDDAGNFWYIIVHSDTRLIGTPIAVMLDEIPVEIDTTGGLNRVTTSDFTKENKEGGTPVFSVWTTTYTATNPIPPAVSAFKAAFPEWTDDHKLVGTTYSVVKCDALKQEDRYKVMVWRGVFGIGEPSISVVGNWDVQYDPRDASQDINDRSTWKAADNLALLWAWFRTHPLGRGKPMSSVDWDMVAAEANICDETILDKNGISHKRYGGGIAIPDSKERGAAEQEIMMAGDGVILHSSSGKAYLKVGSWAEPTLSLSRQRDVMAMASRTAQDGEMQTDGVIVRYTEPEFGWIAQPCAPWKNPRYYEEGRAPRYLSVDALACHDHNQAVRLAKAIGETSQSPYRLQPTVGLRGLKAKRERLVSLDYDDKWNGTHKIATTVEEDEAGLSVSFGIVPIDENHWTLLPGEEGDKPAPVVNIEYDKALPYPTNVSVYGAPVPNSGGASVRLEATFDPSPRVDRRYEFQYKKSSELSYRPMVVLMDDQLAYSDTVSDSVQYDVQYRTVTTSGRANDWKTPPVTVTAVADSTAPGPVTAAISAGGAGKITHSWTSPNSANYLATRILVNTTNDMNTAATAHVEYGAANSPDSWTQTGVAAGTWYAWLVAINGSGVPSTAVATGPITVT